MPAPGMRWRHVIISTYSSWLPGDPRGFRSKNHKIHSSGDYKIPPPEGEHAGLFRYSQRISGPPVVIPPDCRATVGTAILTKLKKLKYRCLVISVAATHAHLQVELPDDLSRIRHIIGQCKTVSSHAIRDRVPGRVWARDGAYKAINTIEHQCNVFQYILDQDGAWIWSHKEDLAPSLGVSGANPEGDQPLSQSN
jgi:hypothetical protein